MSYSEKLDLTAFEKAVFQLEDSLNLYNSNIIQNDPRYIIHIRAASIQAFEFTYELACKMMKRYLDKAEFSSADVHDISFSNLIRTANEHGLLLNDIVQWKEYRKERGITSHTYDEEKAIEVFEEIPAFLEEAKFLLIKLKEYNNDL